MLKIKLLFCFKGVVMRAFAVVSSVLCFFYSVAMADVTVSGSAAFQILKKGEDHTTGNVDESFVRGEIKVAGKSASGLIGTIHLRTEPKLASGVKDIDLQPRQICFKLPVSVVDLMAGRWYEVYGQGNNYFGQYLFGVGTDKETKMIVGNGSMNTDYKMIDGMKATVNLASIKSALHIAVLPSDMQFGTTSLMAMFGGSPIEDLNYNVAGNFQVITPDGIDPVHRAIVNCGYTIIKEMNCTVFGEAAIINFDEAAENAWFLLGFALKVPFVFDRFQAEFDIKNHRNGDTKPLNSLRWMVLMRKRVMDLTFDLNVGADPAMLGSKRPCEVGAIFRVTASL
jgi:hypothetical protein